MLQVKTRKSAFTLVELLVVVAIIGVLVGMLLPAVQKVRESSSRVRCQNNMRQVALAFHSYHDAYGVIPQHNLNSGWSSLVKVLPFCEEGNFYNQLDVPNTSPLTNPLAQTPIPLYSCPSSPGVAQAPVAGDDSPATASPATMMSWTATYVGGGASFSDAVGVHSFKTCSGNEKPADGNAGTGVILPHMPIAIGSGQFGNGVNPHRTNVTITLTSILDGTSSTLLLGETIDLNSLHSGSAVGTAFYKINAANEDSAFRSNHNRGGNFAMCDGSVHFLHQNIDMVLFKALASIAGGEQASLPE